MSRSVRKVPGFTDRNPWMKRYANKRLRAVATRVLRNHLVQDTEFEMYYESFELMWEYEEPTFYVPELELNYGLYKKHTCPWDICDWSFCYWSPMEIKGDIEELYPYHNRTYGEYLDGLDLDIEDDHRAWWRGQEKREGQRKSKLYMK